MTPRERETAKVVSRVIRCARKQMGWTQVETARHLGISQSALSKVEAATLLPSICAWFEFCRLAGISPESHLFGYIDRRQGIVPSSRMDIGSFKLPKKYRRYQGSKVRATMPFVSFARAQMGDPDFKAYLKEEAKVDPDYFVDLDHQIGLDFILDLSRHLIRSGSLKPQAISTLARAVQRPFVHGSLHTVYDQTRDPMQLIETLINNSHYYERNFEYVIEDYGKKSIDLSVSPRKEVEDISFRGDAILGNFLCRYKRYYFSHFTSYGGGSGSNLEELECLFNGARRCVYRVVPAVA